MKLSQEKIAEIEKLLKTDLSYREIAERTNVSWRTIRYLRKKLGLPRRKEPPKPKITNEELIFLKNLGFSLKEIAKIKRMSYQAVYSRARKLANQGYIEILPSGFALSQALKAKFQLQRKKALEKLIALLKSEGVVPISRIKEIGSSNVLRRIIMEFSDIFCLFNLSWAREGRGSNLGGTRFIKPEFLGRKFLALKSDRTAIVRFFMGIFKERKYGQYDAKAISHWLKKFGLKNAERIAIITHLGYEYKRGLKLKKRGKPRFKSLKIGKYFMATMRATGKNFRIHLPIELSNELREKFGDNTPIAIKYEKGKLIILLNPKITPSE